jgi:integrase
MLGSRGPCPASFSVWYRPVPTCPVTIAVTNQVAKLLSLRRRDLNGEDPGLVFPNGIGKVESYANLIDRGFGPIQIEAGVSVQREAVDAAGAAVLVTVAKYGLHALRHACASLWIEQGHNPKQIQTLMGHSSIKVTFDTYGHLFADSEADQRAAEGVEFRLLGS